MVPKLGDLGEFLMFSGLASRKGRWPDLRPQGALAAIALGAVWGTCVSYSMGVGGVRILPQDHESSWPVSLTSPQRWHC